VDPPTIAPACAAAERRHLGVWSACDAEGKCLTPYAHFVLLDLAQWSLDHGVASPLSERASIDHLRT